MKAVEPMTEWILTGETSLLGTSIPTMDIWSGIGAMRTPVAPNAKAISSARLVSLFSRTPWSSSSSYRVTEGPLVTLTMLASIPKEWSYQRGAPVGVELHQRLAHQYLLSPQ